ncbi:MAG: hypothetical protein D6814_10115 [Calditrichaeota bacterium]|nr:MAG: hypothetical protein D6814_10115 [Calditrichota bacterium]
MQLIRSKNNWLYRAIILSFLLHLLLLLTAGWAIKFSWFSVSENIDRDRTPQKPLVFEFENPEVVETPESARTEKPADKPRYLSDKNARAQNETAESKLPLGAAYSDGVVDHPQIAETPSVPHETSTLPRPAEKSGKRVLTFRQSDPSSFSREFLTQPQTQYASSNGELYRDKSRNLQSRSSDMGDFSLNTYAWDFAPYMIRLKRKIEKNIFPPPAFTYMGIIHGQAILRFRISPEGKLAKLEIVSYNGHKSLLNTSLKAVEVSAPFEPLPDNFPEKYLEVTGRFDYITNR